MVRLKMFNTEKIVKRKTVYPSSPSSGLNLITFPYNCVISSSFDSFRREHRRQRRGKGNRFFS